MNETPELENAKANSQLFENADVAAVIFLAVFPDFIYSLIYFLGFQTTDSESLFFTLLQLVVRSLQVSCPVLLLIHLKRFAWSDFGFVPFRIFKDTLLAIGLTALCYSAYRISDLGVIAMGIDVFSAIDDQPYFDVDITSTLATVILILTASAANGFAEELVMRSFLITRFNSIFKSRITSVIVTSLLFASYHLYQGVYAATNIFVVGLIFGVYFAFAKRFWPIAIAHCFMDAIPFGLIALQAQ